MSEGRGNDTDLWSKAVRALDGARSNLDTFPEITANRCYYAVFYALSALFMLEGKTFKSHGGVEQAVHRDLVHTGKWSTDLGNDYSRLFKLHYPELPATSCERRCFIYNEKVV